MKHNNIVRYIDVQEDINKKHISILLEYVVGGSLNDIIHKYGMMNENLVQKYTKDILQGIEYLHYHGVVHRDIKGANILVDNNGICKVAGKINIFLKYILYLFNRFWRCKENYLVRFNIKSSRHCKLDGTRSDKIVEFIETGS